MNVFRDYTFHWWQFGLLKVCMIAFGVLLGVYGAEYFQSPTVRLGLLILFVVPAVYLMSITLKRSGEQK